MINEDKGESSTNRNMIFFDEWSKYYVWLDPPYGKFEKSKNVHQFILMNVQINFFGVPLFYLRNVIFLAKILRALLSNKNEILHYLKKSIVQ